MLFLFNVQLRNKYDDDDDDDDDGQIKGLLPAGTGWRPIWCYRHWRVHSVTVIVKISTRAKTGMLPSLLYGMHASAGKAAVKFFDCSLTWNNCFRVGEGDHPDDDGGGGGKLSVTLRKLTLSSATEWSRDGHLPLLTATWPDRPHMSRGLPPALMATGGCRAEGSARSRHTAIVRHRYECGGGRAEVYTRTGGC